MNKPKVWIWLQKSNGKRQKTYIVQWVDPETNRVRSKSCGRDRTRAEAFKVDKLIDMEQGIGDVRPAQWETFVESYLADLRVLVDCRDKAEATYTEAELVLRQFGEICDPATTLKIDYAMLKRFQVARLGMGVKKTTVNKNLTSLRSMFNWAISMGRMAKNPMTKSDLFLKVPKVVKRVCSGDEITALLNACPNDRWLAFCLIGVQAGFRKGEITHLEWADVDFDLDLLHIRYKDNWQPKSSKERTVPMSPPIREVLLRLQPNRFQCSYFILSNNGGPLHHNVSYGFECIVKAAGLVDKKNPVTPHALRRTFGTNLANKNTPLKVLMELMGHTKIETTMAFYVQATDEGKRQAVMTLTA